MSQNKRFVWADSLKGWLMVLVIIGHVIQTVRGEAMNDSHLWNIIYSFHMPAFMAVSGWLAYREIKQLDYQESLWRRARQLLIPYGVWSLLFLSIRGNSSWASLADILLKPDLFFWFLWVLFFICALFILSQWISEHFHINEIYILLLLCVSLMCIMVITEFRLFGFQFISYYFLFYTLGYCIHKYPQMQIENKLVLLLLVIIWAVLAWSWKMHELPGWIPLIPHLPSSLLQYVYRGLTAFIAISFILNSAHLFLNSKSGVNGLMAKLGKVSLGLYVVHLLLMELIVMGVTSIFPSLTVTMTEVLIFVIAFTLSVAIVILLMKNKWTAMIGLGKI